MLKYLPLFFGSLRRKPVRTTLTVASIVVAFLLFGLLKTMEGALSLAADLAGRRPARDDAQGVADPDVSVAAT